MQILIDRLTAIKPKYGLIFKELLKGNMQPLNIAKALSMGKSQVYEDVPKVQAAAKKLYFELMDRKKRGLTAKTVRPLPEGSVYSKY